MLSSFLGMLTHEFSNLIQTLQVSIGSIQHRLGGRSSELGVETSLGRLQRSTREAEDLLASLRGLMVQNDPEGKPVVLFDCLADVVSVCQSDAKTRGVQLEFSLEAAKEVVVMADDVMLQVATAVLAGATVAGRTAAGAPCCCGFKHRLLPAVPTDSPPLCLKHSCTEGSTMTAGMRCCTRADLRAMVSMLMSAP